MATTTTFGIGTAPRAYAFCSMRHTLVAHLTRAFGRDIPVVIVSGESSSEHLARLDASGLPLLHKPVAPAGLRAALAHAMRAATSDTGEGKLSVARPA